ncbi:hypothetical protein SAMN04515674_101108 [Pseudarcicella hirudinis]|uniref:Uncharacterized protein n=1 Tax=Pseudarcicella hirudinis TaxID=1079859 RepID=A0A1I5M4U1_9BACT|nr:hypothetical protein SAMN04515674_101108 [Pseudarcicella hirudinis]
MQGRTIKIFLISHNNPASKKITKAPFHGLKYSFLLIYPSVPYHFKGIPHHLSGNFKGLKLQKSAKNVLNSANQNQNPKNALQICREKFQKKVYD